MPQEAIDIMTVWYDAHYTNPYPTFKDCEDLAEAGKVSINQVKQWFVNVRRRTQNQFRKRRSNVTKKSNRMDNSNQEEILRSLPVSSSEDSGFSNNSSNSKDESALLIKAYQTPQAYAPQTYTNNGCKIAQSKNASINPISLPQVPAALQYSNDYVQNNMQYYNQSYDSPNRIQNATNYYNYTSTPQQTLSSVNYGSQPANMTINSSYNDIDTNYNYYYQSSSNANMRGTTSNCNYNYNNYNQNNFSFQNN